MPCDVQTMAKHCEKHHCVIDLPLMLVESGVREVTVGSKFGHFLAKLGPEATADRSGTKTDLGRT